MIRCPGTLITNARPSLRGDRAGARAHAPARRDGRRALVAERPDSGAGRLRAPRRAPAPHGPAADASLARDADARAQVGPVLGPVLARGGRIAGALAQDSSPARGGGPQGIDEPPGR